MKIERSDRRLLIWAGVFMLVVILALTFLSQDEEESGIPSTYSVQRSGAKAAFLLLQQSGYKVQRCEHSPSNLPADPAHTVLVLASPFRAPTSDEKNALQTFVNRGGKILATGSRAAIYVPQAEAKNERVPSPRTT
jgi:hypothetical protein